MYINFSKKICRKNESTYTCIVYMLEIIFIYCISTMWNEEITTNNETIAGKEDKVTGIRWNKHWGIGWIHDLKAFWKFIIENWINDINELKKFWNEQKEYLTQKIETWKQNIAKVIDDPSLLGNSIKSAYNTFSQRWVDLSKGVLDKAWGSMPKAIRYSADITGNMVSHYWDKIREIATKLYSDWGRAKQVVQNTKNNLFDKLK